MKLVNEKYLEIAVLEIAKALSSTLDLNKVLNLSIDLLEGLISYSCGLIALRGDIFKVNLSRYIDKKEIDKFEKKYISLIVSTIEKNADVQTFCEDKLLFKIKKDTKCSLVIPIYFEGAPIGFMYFENEIKEAYTDLNLKTLSILSSQIAIAIKNAQLFESVSQKVAELTALYEISKKLASILDYEKIIELIVDFAHKHFGVDFVFLWIWNEKEKKLVLAKQRGVNGMQIKNIKIKIGDGIIGNVAKNKESIFISNTDVFKKENAYEFGELKVIKSIVAMPLVLQDKIVGVISIASREINGISNENIKMLSILSSLFAISLQNAKLYEINEMLAITDGLTELYNHRFFQEKLDEEIKRISRYKGNLSVAMFDIDNFKQINDKFGHLQGDMVLKSVAEILKKSFRETDYVARYGGEEFAIILPETDALGALVAVERVRKLIDEYKFPTIDGKKSLKVEISAGVSSYPEYANDKAELLKKVDNSLYKAKKLGKNRVCLGT